MMPFSVVTASSLAVLIFIGYTMKKCIAPKANQEDKAGEENQETETTLIWTSEEPQQTRQRRSNEQETVKQEIESSVTPVEISIV